jgi:lipid A 4'-phosphatase
MQRVAVWLVGLLLVSGLFWAAPALDLSVSGLFFDGTGFPVRSIRWIEAIRLTLYAAEDVAAAVTLVLGLVTVWRGIKVVRLAARDWFFAFGVFALGPGLVVNGILKRFWGRARPSAVVEFGGTAQFTPPWQIADQCPNNCSFVSGEMAGAVALAILLLMVVATNRAALGRAGYRAAVLAIAAVPLFTAWQRVAAGQHFLSDVVLGGLVVVLIAALLRRLVYPAGPRASAVDFPPSTP